MKIHLLFKPCVYLGFPESFAENWNGTKCVFVHSPSREKIKFRELLIRNQFSLGTDGATFTHNGHYLIL